MSFWYGKPCPAVYREIAALHFLQNLVNNANDRYGRDTTANERLKAAADMLKTQGYEIRFVKVANPKTTENGLPLVCIHIRIMSIRNIDTDEITTTFFPAFDGDTYAESETCKLWGYCI